MSGVFCPLCQSLSLSLSTRCVRVSVWQRHISIHSCIRWKIQAGASSTISESLWNYFHNQLAALHSMKWSSVTCSRFLSTQEPDATNIKHCVARCSHTDYIRVSVGDTWHLSTTSDRLLKPTLLSHVLAIVEWTTELDNIIHTQLSLTTDLEHVPSECTSKQCSLQTGSAIEGLKDQELSHRMSRFPHIARNWRPMAGGLTRHQAWRATFIRVRETNYKRVFLWKAATNFTIWERQCSKDYIWRS